MECVISADVFARLLVREVLFCIFCSLSEKPGGTLVATFNKNSSVFLQLWGNIVFQLIYLHIVNVD